MDLLTITLNLNSSITITGLPAGPRTIANDEQYDIIPGILTAMPRAATVIQRDGHTGVNRRISVDGLISDYQRLHAWAWLDDVDCGSGLRLTDFERHCNQLGNPP